MAFHAICTATVRIFCTIVLVQLNIEKWRNVQKSENHPTFLFLTASVQMDDNW